LAEVSRDLVITGEGSDNLFGGPKNNQMLYGQQRNPSASLGWLYALAHNRFAHRLHEIFKQGVTLTDYITDYLNNLLVFYPGDLIRKLFYLNMLMKAGSMIFQQSYYPGRIYNIKIRHPFAALGVYKAAFSLANDRKYKYPATKLALIELYGKRLPESIVRRKKSGTIIPLKYYLRNFSRQKFDFSTLANTNFFNEEFFQQMSKSNAYEKDALLVYALITLNLWINQKGEIDHVESLSAKTSHYERSPSAVFV